MVESKKDFYKNVGTRIKNLRLQHGYSVDELATKAGISTKYMYCIENGDVRFSTEICNRICSSLGVAPSVVLSEKHFNVSESVLFKVYELFTEEEKLYIKKTILKSTQNH